MKSALGAAWPPRCSSTSQPWVQLPLKSKQRGMKITRCLPVAIPERQALLRMPPSLCRHLPAGSWVSSSYAAACWRHHKTQAPSSHWEPPNFWSSAQSCQLSTGLDVARISEAQELASVLPCRHTELPQVLWLQTPPALQQARLGKGSQLSSLPPICRTMPRWDRRESWMHWSWQQANALVGVLSGDRAVPLPTQGAPAGSVQNWPMGSPVNNPSLEQLVCAVSTREEMQASALCSDPRPQWTFAAHLALGQGQITHPDRGGSTQLCSGP